MKRCVKKVLTAFFISSMVLVQTVTAFAAAYEFRTGENGKLYWYENGVRQGTYDDPKGVLGDGTVRGREIYDPATDAWYWLDSAYNGAKACGKEVWIPYIYQDEANFSSVEISQNAQASDDGLQQFVESAIRQRTGKWVRYDENGKMLKGWVTISGALADCYPDQAGNTYYYDHKTGLMAKGNLSIDGQMYHFDEVTGVCDLGTDQMSENLKLVFSLTRTYDPDGYEFLQYEKQKDGTAELESWAQSGFGNPAYAADTCVHESFHGYVGNHYSYDWGSRCWSHGYYIQQGKMIYIQERAHFKTEEWAKDIPANLRTFRYDTYVAEGASPSANQNGAYGLLNEFSAYYWGMHNQLQFYPYYCTSPTGLDTLTTACTNGIQAFCEFRFYILGYLNYAKNNHYDVYQSFMNNQEFVNVYCIMERKHENQIKNATDLGVSYWTDEAKTLYNEVSKQEYRDVENELFSRATESVLESVSFNP